MTEFRTIEIDFDIHKLIEAERQSFSESPNAVLRRLLGITTPEPSRSGKDSQGKSWAGDGVALPHGTDIRMSYNGRLHEGQIRDGMWVIGEKSFSSPSGAASGVAVTKSGKMTRLDGWTYWEVRLPGQVAWTPIRNLRSEQSPFDSSAFDGLIL